MSSEARLAECAIGGVAPGEVTTPLNVADLSAAMRHAAEAALTVGVCGGRSKIEYGAPPASLVVDTTSMDRIIEHADGDLVVTAQAGVRLAELQRHVAPARQCLALDPPEPEATVGGVVAAAASGPRRLRYGTPRDLLIGIGVVLVDGTVAHAGGKVVKNVAGYDLGRLFVGSFGTLGVITECTFRLHPLAAARRVVVAAPQDPFEAFARLATTRTVPSAVEWDGRRLVVVVEAVEAAAAEQAEAIAGAIGGTVQRDLPEGFGTHPWRPGGVGLKITHRLGALREVLGLIHEHLPDWELTAHLGSGVVEVGTAESDLSVVEPLRTAVSRHEGAVVVVEAPLAAKREIDVWGPAPGLDVMRRIKAQFDPDGRMSPGRFVGGI
jgi:glycolate oxidase FAD binding subunit